jgi:hypothetical protein
MKLRIEQLLELHAAHHWFGSYDILGDVLNFRVRHNLRILEPLAKTAQESVVGLLERHKAPADAESPARAGAPVADPVRYAADRKQLMAEEVEVIGLRPITWSLLQSARIVIAGEKGATKERLPLNSRALAALGDVLEGEPQDLVAAEAA